MIVDSIGQCVEQLNATPGVDFEISQHDMLNDLLEQVGEQHRRWLRNRWKRIKLQFEPIIEETGCVVAQPLFWIQLNEDQEEQGTIFAYGEPGDSTGAPSIQWLPLGQDPLIR